MKEEERALLQQIGVELVGGAVEDATRGVKLLGVHVGHPEYVDAQLQQEWGSAGKGACFVQSCADLTSSRAMFRLLRHCARPRIDWTLRAIAPAYSYGCRAVG